MKTIRRYYRIFGRVQGVGFRYRMMVAAESAGCTGYVTNEYDGSVTVEIQGRQEAIDYVFQEVQKSPLIRIERMDMIEIKPVEGETIFYPR